MKFNKGFTLIELLVVIAIIGILSSVVLASLTSARSKGTDAAIQNELSNMRAQAELFYSNNNHYGITAAATTAAHCVAATNVFGTTTAVGSLENLLSDVASKNGGTLGTSKVVCSTTGSPAATWAVIASTSASTGTSFCVDSTGASKSSVGIDSNGACI